VLAAIWSVEIFDSLMAFVTTFLQAGTKLSITFCCLVARGYTSNSAQRWVALNEALLQA